MANNNLAAIPEIWAREGLMVLTEHSVALPHVDRQYSDELANYGDTVNAYRAGRRTIRRKTDDDDYTPADANLTAVPVKLDQHFVDVISLKDRERSLSIANLTQTHLVPSMQAMARAVDRVLLGHAAHAFLRQGTPAKRSGKLRGMSKTNSSDYILEAQQVLHTQLAPDGVRAAMVHQTAQTHLQANELFASAEKRGNNNTLTTGQVGRIYNTDVMMSQNVNYVDRTLADIQSATVNNSGGYAAGHATAMTVTDPGTNYTAGEFVVLEENGQPTYLSATTGTTSITLNEALKYAVTDASAITHYLKCANEATERVAGYAKSMTFTHTAGKNLQVGQLIAFGTSSRHTYTIIEVSATASTTTTVLLDRPLDATVASGADAFPGPAGGINPILSPGALAFVSRPLVLIEEGHGVRSAVVSFGGIGIRVTSGYVITTGAYQINIDLLAGVKQLNADLGTVMLS